MLIYNLHSILPWFFYIKKKKNPQGHFNRQKDMCLCKEEKAPKVARFFKKMGPDIWVVEGCHHATGQISHLVG